MARMRIWWRTWLVPVLLLATMAYAIAEDITLTTYYPSPRGMYEAIGVNKLAVDVDNVAVPSEFQAMQAGDTHVGRSLIIGAGGGSGFAYDELVEAGFQPADGDVLIKHEAGIGTFDPRAQLHIAGDSNPSASEPDRYGQLQITNALSGFGENPDRVFFMGIDTTDDYAGLAYVNENDQWGPLVLQGHGGNVGIGTTAPVSTVEVVSTSGTDLRGLTLTHYVDSAVGGQINIRKARGDKDNPDNVLNGDTLFELQGRGHDGNAFARGALLRVVAGEAWESGKHGSYLTLETVADGTTNILERVRVAENGNVGIGETSPSNLLELRKSSGDPALTFGIDTADEFTLGVDDSDSDKFKIAAGSALGAGSDHVTITSDGKVGIGVTNPDYVLEVSDDATNRSARIVLSGHNSVVSGNAELNLVDLDPPGTGHSWTLVNEGRWGNVTYPLFYLWHYDGDDLDWKNPLVIADTSDDAMSLWLKSHAPDEEAGIRFYRANHLVANEGGGIGVAGAGGDWVSGSTPGDMVVRSLNGGDLYLSARSTGLLRFTTTNSDVERMVILNDGKVGIGTSTPGSYQLYVAGSAYATGGWSGSSRTLKTEIQPLRPLEYAEILDQLADLDVVRFRWKPESGILDERSHLGIIAEEAPELITDEHRTAVGTTDYLAFLAASIKALKAENDVLKERLAILEQSLAAPGELQQSP